VLGHRLAIWASAGMVATIESALVPVPVGVFLPQMRMTFDQIEAKVRAAEELGYQSAWFMDHLAPPAATDQPMLEGWTTVAALAARTSTIRLGHLVLCGPFRHPALLAKMASSLDVISNGRLDLGIGWGSVPDELRRYGFGDERPAVRAAKLVETLEILEALFTGEPASYAGSHFTVTDARQRPRPVNGRIPIHIGGAGPKLTMPIVRDHADWWNVPSYGVDRYAELRPLAGDGVRVSIQHPIGVAASTAARDETLALLDKRFARWGGVVGGTPDEVATTLRREVDLGIELFILQFSDFGTPESMKLFAEEVLPAL
jgi:alkanesulfonate monooxygenase SsuD/methylene tetrahydromethanopterin reductase-like flavin-dependent oxidoreductase (luciferase family)